MSSDEETSAIADVYESSDSDEETNKPALDIPNIAIDIVLYARERNLLDLSTAIVAITKWLNRNLIQK